MKSHKVFFEKAWTSCTHCDKTHQGVYWANAVSALFEEFCAALSPTVPQPQRPAPSVCNVTHKCSLQLACSAPTLIMFCWIRTSIKIQSILENRQVAFLASTELLPSYERGRAHRESSPDPLPTVWCQKMQKTWWVAIFKEKRADAGLFIWGSLTNLA